VLDPFGIVAVCLVLILLGHEVSAVFWVVWIVLAVPTEELAGQAAAVLLLLLIIRRFMKAGKAVES